MQFDRFFFSTHIQWTIEKKCNSLTKPEGRKYLTAVKAKIYPLWGYLTTNILTFEQKTNTDPVAGGRKQTFILDPLKLE